jgi:hypothetical protein
MSTTLTTKAIKVALSYDYENVLTMGNTVASNQHTYSKSMTNGTGGSGTADLVYSTSTTIAASSSSNIDLAGSLTDFFGNTLTFARIKILCVELTNDTTASSIKVGGASSNGFANWIGSAGTFATDQPYVRVRNGGILLLGCTDGTGYAVTAGTADILKLTNEDGANTATIHLTIIGSTA